MQSKSKNELDEMSGKRVLAWRLERQVAMTEKSIVRAQKILSEVKGHPQGRVASVAMNTELARLLLEAANKMQTRAEKRQEAFLAKMIRDPEAKAHVATLLDSCFRSENAARTVDQVIYLFSRYGIPSFLSRTQKWLTRLFIKCGQAWPRLSSYLLQRVIKHYVRDVIAPGEMRPLRKVIKKWQKQGVKINLNRLGEAILGENEATARFDEYMRDLADPTIGVISIKISSIASQLNLLAWDETLSRLKRRLRPLFRQALRYKKFINLDMEEYRDLQLTKQLFMDVLSEPEFLHLSAGIALQSYIPDSFAIQQEITEWAIKRQGAKVKIRIVKGANLGMERVDASLKEWPQAPYKTKSEADANFKKMLHYGMQKEHASAVSLGIGSHNLFDLAYACLLATSNDVAQSVTIEMLAGMAPHITRAILALWPDVLLYLPCAKKNQFHTSMAYLMRRLDENTAPDNFLTHLFGLQAETRQWLEQEELFSSACFESDTVSTTPRRIQNRKLDIPRDVIFNEPDTDFSLKANRDWANEIIQKWQTNYHEVHLVIKGHELVSSKMAQGIDPSRPGCKIHTHFLAQTYQVEIALDSAMMQAKEWASIRLQTRLAMLQKVAQILRQMRADLIGAMMQESGKIIIEADSEVSEAIDFVEYYTKEAQSQAHAGKLFSTGKVALVLTPWNFPCSIPCSALTSSLLAGYSVIFKPAPEAVLSGWLLAQAFWNAGVPKDVLQFITCEDEPMGSKLVHDPRVDVVILTGGTQTARKFLNLRPSIKLFAETGGKNSLIVSRLSDRDLAVKDVIHSAFGYAGQKCSACSLLILEDEVYHSQSFRDQLLDAATHLAVGQSYNLNTVVSPLIRPPSPHLLRALTTLDDGESWLVKPKADPQNPHLWSPGIKLGVRPGSFMHQTELFGPMLGVMCAKDLGQALEFANGTPYGLTAGLHSLDPREYAYWREKIEAGNCYHNRAITGAIVARQPFGGCKASSFGVGMKVGGPNYLLQLANSAKLPAQGVHEIGPRVTRLASALRELKLYKTDCARFYKAAQSMAFWWVNYFQKHRKLRRLVGQDNFLEFRPKRPLFVLLQENDLPIDSLLVLAAAATCGCKVILGATFSSYRRLFRQGPLGPIFEEFGWKAMSPPELVEQIRNTPQAYLRALDMPSDDILESISSYAGALDVAKPTNDGRVELLHYIHEVAVSSDYHRYGNLMDREGELCEPTR